MKELEEKIQKILLEALYKDTNCWAETVTEIAALIEPYQKLIEAQDELIKHGAFFNPACLSKGNKTFVVEKLRDKIKQLKKELKQVKSLGWAL